MKQNAIVRTIHKEIIHTFAYISIANAHNTMIEYLKGDLTELTPTTATVECHGVGYLANISLYTYAAIQNRPQVKLYIHEAIREDAHVLYGFVDKRERELFLLLISSVGGDTTGSPMGNALFAEPNNEVLDSAVAALAMLGYTAAASQKVVKAILKEQPSVSVEAAIKEALRRL